jgi:RNA polymerase sigma-70 factor (ECF subfamily)
MSLPPNGGVAPPPRPPPLPAFADLYREHLPRTLEWLCRMGVPERDVPDVAQDAWLRVHRRLPECDLTQPFAPWLWTVVYHAACDYLGRAHVRLERLSASGDLAGETILPAVERAMDARTLLPLVLQSLPPERREVFLMIEVEGFSYADVARVLGIPVETVHSRLRRASEEVAAALKRIQAAERRRTGAAFVAPVLFLDWRALAAQSRAVPEVPEELSARIWEGVMRRIAAETPVETRTERPGAVMPPEPPRAPAPPVARPTPPPLHASRAWRALRGAGLFRAGAIAGGALVYWLLRGPSAAAPAPGTAESAASCTPGSPHEPQSAPGTPGPAGTARSEASAGAARSEGSAGAPPSAAPTHAPSAVEGASKSRIFDRPVSTASPAAPAEDFRPVLAALEAGRVLVQSGQCAEARERLRPHAGRLAAGPYSALYRAFLKSLDECGR